MNWKVLLVTSVVGTFLAACGDNTTPTTAPSTPSTPSTMSAPAASTPAPMSAPASEPAATKP